MMTNENLIDEYGNIHQKDKELSRGGQGIVYRSKDPDLAIKISFKKNLSVSFQNIRQLPFPENIPIALPLAILKNESGYIMHLLNEMRPLRDLNDHRQLKDQLFPQWLNNIKDEKWALDLLNYAQTGSTRFRLIVLSKCAAILARLHSAGLVYGDISPNNIFIGRGESPPVWLIDADNLRFETMQAKTVFTPGYGAPEVVQQKDGIRPRTDIYSFAILAFCILTLAHPFEGQKVKQADDDWADDNNIEEQAYAGHLPFVYDENDDSNAYCGLGIPLKWIATPQIQRLFQKTLGIGRVQPHQRPTLFFWALELIRAFDQSLICPSCSMSYFEEFEQCPYCDARKPPFIRLKTPHWQLIRLINQTELNLPHRLFYPFCLQHYDQREYTAEIDFRRETLIPARGDRPFPNDLSIEFIA